MGKATSKYEMSRETEAMFDVYTALTNFEPALMDGLQTVYGEEQGCQIFSEKYSDKIQELGKMIFEEIQNSVWDQLMTKQDGEAAIII